MAVRRDRLAARQLGAVVGLSLLLGATTHTQEVSLEYQVKAVYLFNFVKYTEWPDATRAAPITICVAEPNRFGDALDEAIKGEQVNGRSLEVRLLGRPEKGCHVLFVPEGTPGAPYLDAVKDSPTLTVGETQDFIEQGGIVRFFLDTGMVRFHIDQAAAKRAAVRISSHVLNLSRDPARRG